MNKFSLNLRRLRQEEGLTQKALAHQLNVSNSTISNWENGTSEPDITMLKTMAEFFNITVDQLLGEVYKISALKSSKEVVRILAFNPRKDQTFLLLNGFFIFVLLIAYFFPHQVILGFFFLSLILLIIYSLSFIIKKPSQRYIEGELETHETLVYERNIKGKDKLLGLSLGKFIFSFVTIIYGYILIMDSYNSDSQDHLLLGAIMFLLIISYLLLFIFVYPLFMNKNDLDYEKAPLGFNLWVLNLITLTDFLILLIPSIAFIFYPITLFDLAFPLQFVPLILMGNYSVSYLYKQSFYDYFKDYKLLKLNTKTHIKKPF
ncbi:MAG: helix-turn-helix domain-containing protein [Candidatus Izemoplasmataceae bacterium]